MPSADSARTAAASIGPVGGETASRARELADHALEVVGLTADGGRTLFMSGEGASPDGDRPFLVVLAQ